MTNVRGRLISLLLILLLTACNASTVSSEISSSDVSEGSVHLSLHMITPVDGIYSSNGTGTEQGYYFLQASNNGQNIMYIDFATKQQIYLSSDLSSTHDNSTDSSWFSNSIVSLFVIDQKLYYVGASEQGNPCIYETQLNGSQRKKIVDLPSSASMVRGIATDGESLYTTLDFVSPDAQIARQLCQISLSDGSIEVLMDMAELEFLYGASDEFLYLKCTNNVSDIRDDNAWAHATSQLKEYSVRTGEIRVVTEWPARANCGAISNGYFYFMEYQTGVLNAFDLTTGKTKIVAKDIPFTGTMDGIFFDTIWDNHFVYRMTETGKDIYSVVYHTYGVDLSTGEVKSVTLSGGEESGMYLPILWETSQAFLVVYNQEQKAVQIPAPDGSWYDSIIFVQHYALIDKNDFWNNHPQYELIQEIA